MPGLPPVLEDHFQHPRCRGRAAAPAARGRAENPSCGDLLEVEIVVSAARIEQSRFMAQGCSSVIAVASLVMQYLENKQIDDARNMNIEQLVAAAGGLHRTRRHAIAMVGRAVNDALRSVT
ncbi:MAG: iron-sulfur cluster assembly scaffold protein [Planctomycetes bacterium]|nr:iron-sulfur cluster assembly scaffold protein [Planctomycetota bacterium]